MCTGVGKKMLQQYDVKQIDVMAVAHYFHYNQISSVCYSSFDPVVEKNICESNTYFRCLRQFIAWLFCSTRSFIKFHPQQTAREAYLDVFKACGIPYVVVGDAVIPEVVLATSPQLKIFGLCSSVLFLRQ